METLTRVFTEVARARLDKIRGLVENNRQYVGELGKVLHVVRVTAEQERLSAKKKKKISASLLLTSNKRFYYGSLDEKVVGFYAAQTAYQGFVDRFVVGSVGAEMLSSRKYPFPFQSIVFPGGSPTGKEMVDLAEKLTDYQKVLVYYPKFVTILTQQPDLVDVTGLESLSPAQKGEEYYIFEPEIGKILEFFEKQIMELLLEQTFMEAELARIGTQLTTMDGAQQRANTVINETKALLSRAQKSLLNIQSLESASILLRSNYAAR